MDSRRPALVTTLSALHLGLLRRAWRSLGQLVLVTSVSVVLLNVAVLAAPFPFFHLFTIPLAVMAGPLSAWWAWRTRALLSATTVRCPRCSAAVVIPERLAGWPARVGCEGCGIRVEINLA
jgi:chromate transport protein ChrA